MHQRCVRAASLSHMPFSAAPPSVLERTIVSQRFQQPNFALPCTPPICSFEKPEMRSAALKEPPVKAAELLEIRIKIFGLSS